jgi:adenosine deaminase
LLGEYEVCRREFGFDDDCIAGIARTSIEFSSASEAVKFAAVGGIDDWLKSEQN